MNGSRRPERVRPGGPLIFAYAIGFSTDEAAWLIVLAGSGMSEREWLERLRPTVQAAAQPYPRLRKLYAEALREAPENRVDDSQLPALST